MSRIQSNETTRRHDSSGGYEKLAEQSFFARLQVGIPGSAVLLEALVEKADSIRVDCSVHGDAGIQPEDLINARLLPTCESLRNSLSKGTFVDLGCGEKNPKHSQVLASLLGASQFIGVDVLIDSTESHFNDLPVHLIKGDMLKELAALPDRSVGLVLLLNHESIPWQETTNAPYAKALAAELTRVLSEKGAVICNQMTMKYSAIGRNLENLELICEIETSTKIDCFHVFVKKGT